MKREAVRKVSGKPDRQRLLVLLAQHKLSQRKFASELGMDPATASRLFHGLRKLSPDEISKIGSMLKLTSDEVLEHFGQEPSIQDSDTVKVVGWIDSAHNVHKTGIETPRKVHVPGGAPPGCLALRYQTGPGAPWDGWIALYRESTVVGLEAIGSACVVDTGEGVKVRVVTNGSRAGEFVLSDPHWAPGPAE